MNNRYFKITFFLISILLFPLKNSAQNNKSESHINVSMRMIGHEILLSLGDSTSRVLPIEKIDNRYKIQFSTEFEFLPDSMASTIGKVIEKAKLTHDYIVEIENCKTKKVVYSYEIGLLLNTTSIPCKQRAYPLNCYNIFITLLEEKLVNQGKNGNHLQTTERSAIGTKYSVLIWAIIILAFSFIYFFLFRKSKKTVVDPNIISIGTYQFNKKTMSLSFKDSTEELTQKEGDLLSLLYDSANETLERDVILQKVWGDEGDYIGRTLDVFISKLRKKIEGDPSLKIVNIRGVGYKLVISNQ